MRALSRRRRWWAMAGASGLAFLAVAPLPATAATGEVAVTAGAFSPATIQIEPGDTVRWTNEDDAQHRVKQDSSSSEKWDTGNLDQGERKTHTFPEPGQFRYHCELHPQMTGTVLVGDEVETTTTTAPPPTTTTAPPPPSTTTTTEPPGTTTTAPAPTTTAPPATTTTTARPVAAGSEPPTSTSGKPTTTTAGPTSTTTAPPTTTTTLGPTTTTTAGPPPAAPPAAGSSGSPGPKPDVGPISDKPLKGAGEAALGDVSVATGQAASVRAAGGDGTDWGFTLALAALLLAGAFGLWSLWSLRPSRI